MMTANRAGTPSNPLAHLMVALKSAGRLLTRLALGGLALLAASVLALAAAVLGLLIAVAALIFRFSPKRNLAMPRPTRNRQTGAEEGIILEARRTGRGWTVE